MHDVGYEDDELAKVSSTYDSRFSMLSQEQRKIVREHPTKASFLIDKLKNKDPYLKEFILNHHERPKGKGFSRGLDAEKLDQNIESKVKNITYMAKPFKYDALSSYLEDEVKLNPKRAPRIKVTSLMSFILALLLSRP